MFTVNESVVMCCGRPHRECTCGPKGVCNGWKPEPMPEPVWNFGQSEGDNARVGAPQDRVVNRTYETADGELIERPEPMPVPEWEF